MRILHISSAKAYGGSERHFADLTRELSRRGHEVFVALRPSCEWQDRLAFVSPERFLHISIRNSFGMFSARRIASFAEKNGIDIIHAHIARDYIAASVAARSAKTRLVLTRHVLQPMKSFHRFALRNVDAAIAVSSSVRDQLERVFPPGKVHVISNGVDLAATSEEERRVLGREFRDFHSIPMDCPVVSTLGELRVVKGQRDLVLAANEVIKRQPNCRFVVAGVDNTIDKSFRRELKRLARVLGMEANFIWLDWLSDTRPLLAASDIFVSPSHSESFGLAILDAMIAGCPVVATMTGGAIELIPDAKALVPIKDPLSLADTILWYLEHPDDRHELAHDLHAAATERFSLTRMVDSTENLYETLPKK
ncbi:MAG: glycosyltransferase family 4 protein [Acidobacteria bacterium]|nr:glycosyltransferase family 4 protein [Acidobacteriota bacterium]